jgi:hypothetical protein
LHPLILTACDDFSARIEEDGADRDSTLAPSLLGLLDGSIESSGD